MLLQVEMLKGLPVASLADEERVGTVADAVLHPQTGELVGFWVQPNGWFTPKKALSSRDVVGYDHQALLVRSDDALVDPSEVRPFSEIIARRDLDDLVAVQEPGWAEETRDLKFTEHFQIGIDDEVAD